MIDIGYYRKIQNAHGTKSLRDTQRNQIKMDLDRDFDKPLDSYTILIDGKEQDLTILDTTNLDEKKIKSRPNESFKSGQVVEWMNWHWLITKVDRRNDIITTGKIKECTYHLYWQNSKGKIVDKWAYAQNASSYSNGESGNATVTLSANQFLVVMPKDEDTINLRGVKMFIDNCTDNQSTPYELTRPDNVTADYGIGNTYYIFTLRQRNDEKDKLVTLEDGTKVWICDYVEPTAPSQPTNPDDVNSDKTTILCKAILCAEPTIKCGGLWRSFKCGFSDLNGNDIDHIGAWVINCDFADKLTTSVSGNQIKIKVSDDHTDLIGKMFELEFTNTGNTVFQNLTVTIIEYI